jgi:predicted nucleotidyltransferase
MTAAVTDEKIAELSRRIAEAVAPRRIILFGSAARGELRPESDIDVLVVMPDGTHRGHTAERIYRELWGFGVAKDVVVVTTSDLRERRDDPFTVIRQALTEGREVYRAP